MPLQRGGQVRAGPSELPFETTQVRLLPGELSSLTFLLLLTPLTLLEREPRVTHYEVLETA